MHYYRFIVGKLGIYEAVERDCPKDDVRRLQKPDGSWLPKVGNKYPGAISFWTQEGLEKYYSSGLFHWHCSVVREKVQVIVITTPIDILYQDQYQVICSVMNGDAAKTIAVEKLDHKHSNPPKNKD
ncbi:MAG: hypothetical protein HY817_03955 [Candidatus Abawacabacteria bacterium]|nr:hypothetical protein [Candidatus Abawacabacteria bacterium]